MAETKKKKGFFQKLGQLAKDFAEWVEETFSDPELSAELRDDLGLDRSNPATPGPGDPARRARIDAFAAKQDIDEASLLAVVADIKAEVDTVLQFVEAARADQVDARVLFSTMFKLFAVDVLRVRNPGAYALVRLAGLVLDDPEFLQQLDAAALNQLVRGEGPAADGEVWVQRLSMIGGVGVVLLVALVDRLGAVFDAIYGWDPDPEDEGEAAAIAARALTVTLDHPLLGAIRPAFTLIPVPRAHGGPGMFLGGTAGISLPMDVGATTYTFDITGAGQFGLFVPFALEAPRPFASSNPAIRVGAEPRKGDNTPVDAPALVVGTTDGSRLQIGALAYGIELSSEAAAFRLAVRKGLLVIALGKGDAFLRQLPGGNLEVPFDLGFVGSTESGIHFDGGTGLRVNVPVSASLFGVFTVQFLELELIMEPKAALELRGGFSLTLGPFAASVDRVGVSFALERLNDGIDQAFEDFFEFAPPKGIGLVLDAGVVRGGGYLFVDSERGEYAGALELKFLTWSIKAIGLLSTTRPDGSEGWSLLLFVFGQFNLHLGFGIFWTGLGGMIGLHHRSDVDALTAGMRTGALDDILFPANPVADAPRILNRYRTLFPVAQGNLVLGPMLELSFSAPPLVYVRLGLLFDVRNALSGNAPVAVSKVILVGQVLVQLPPRDSGAPAILRLLIDVVGVYDGDTRFLLIRARLRDSFVGIEGFAKLDLAGELVVAVQFGAKPSFVLSAGGFHPKYQDLPERVPRDLDKLRVSFKLGPVSLAVEHYFAVTPNSVQAGQKTSVKADFGVAKIEASLGWDALLYLTPRFFFVVDVQFKAKVKAFGRTLASVEVTATLEGPDEWHFFGSFSFSILWWDKTVPFNERWGEVRTAEVGQASLSQALQAELSNPDNVTVEAPVGPSPVTLAPPRSLKVAHPLGRLAIRQRAVPFGLVVERLGTRALAGGPQAVSVESVALNGASEPTFEQTTESFSRGQFVDLSDDQKLTGPTFEPFPSGVIVGSAGYVAPDALARDVAAGFETVRLDPEPNGLLNPWRTARLAFLRASSDSAAHAVTLGAAARSDRAGAASNRTSALHTSAVAVDEPPLALVGDGDLAEAASLVGAAARSPSLAAQVAASGGHRVVERFEVLR